MADIQEEKVKKVSSRTTCVLCINEIHTKKEHNRDRAREYMFKRTEGKVKYRRGFHKSQFADHEEIKKKLEEIEEIEDLNKN